MYENIVPDIKIYRNPTEPEGFRDTGFFLGHPNVQVCKTAVDYDEDYVTEHKYFVLERAVGNSAYSNRIENKQLLHLLPPL